MSAEEGKLSSAAICSDRDKLPSIRVGGAEEDKLKRKKYSESCKRGSCICGG